jgi:hypothetical protein
MRNCVCAKTLQEENGSDAILLSDLNHSGPGSQATSCSNCIPNRQRLHYQAADETTSATACQTRKHTCVRMHCCRLTLTTRLIEAHTRYTFTRETKKRSIKITAVPDSPFITSGRA